MTVEELRCEVTGGSPNIQLERAHTPCVLMPKGVIYAPDYILKVRLRQQIKKKISLNLMAGRMAMKRINQAREQSEMIDVVAVDHEDGMPEDDTRIASQVLLQKHRALS